MYSNIIYYEFHLIHDILFFFCYFLSTNQQEFLGSGVKVLGVWDDHDYGMNNGGKVSYY